MSFDEMTQSDARSFCQKFGMDLVAVETKAEGMFLDGLRAFTTGSILLLSFIDKLSKQHHRTFYVFCRAVLLVGSNYQLQ